MTERNIIVIVILMMFSHLAYCQVGINTLSPEYDLDVNGKIQVRKEIRLEGGAGSKDVHVLTSMGPNQPPVWTNIPVAEASLGITESVVKSDQVGIIYMVPTTPFVQMDPLAELTSLSGSSVWKEIPGLRSTITPRKNNNRVVASIQTIFQLGANRNVADAVVAIGIFVDGQLRSTRTCQLMSRGYGMLVFDLFDAFENLSIKANNESYEIKIAACLRYFDFVGTGTSSIPESERKVYIGTSDDTTINTNPFLNQTSLKLDLFE